MYAERWHDRATDPFLPLYCRAGDCEVSRRMTLTPVDTLEVQVLVDNGAPGELVDLKLTRQ